MASKTPVARKDRYSSIGAQACPKCGGDLFRIPRRAIDRARSLFSPVRRFRCHFFSCHWEGSLRVSPKDFEASGDIARAGILAPPSAHARARRLPRAFVVHMVLVAAGLLAILTFATTDWLSPREANSALSDDQWAASAKLKRDGVSLGRDAKPATGQKQPVAIGSR